MDFTNLPPVELAMYLFLSRKYYVAALSSNVDQKHLKDKKSWERGWFIDLPFDYPCLIETST